MTIHADLVARLQAYQPALEEWFNRSGEETVEAAMVPTAGGEYVRVADVRDALAALPPPADPQLCEHCQQPMVCPAGTAERIAGLEAMLDETLTRAEQAEAKLAAAPPADLVALGDRLRTQDNQMTAHPIFVVEHRDDKRRPWEFVTACLTDDGARSYMKANGHNLRKCSRIFVHSGYRNDEWIGLRNYLLSLHAAPRVPDTPQGCETQRITNDRLTRLEVIDETGRAYTRHNVSMTLSYQDDGRTLKVFIPALAAPPQEPPR